MRLTQSSNGSNIAFEFNSLEFNLEPLALSNKIVILNFGLSFNFFDNSYTINFSKSPVPKYNDDKAILCSASLILF